MSTVRQGWDQAVIKRDPQPWARNFYYWTYVVFFCGFLFFPSSKAHNNFFYVILLIPSLMVFYYLFPVFRKNRLFVLIMAYFAFLLMTNFWGANVSLQNIAIQIKHLLYVVAFITASIVIEAYYPEKTDRLLLYLAGSATLAYLLTPLWWYQSHPFPSTQINDILGRMTNPILAGCIAGIACLTIIDAIQTSSAARIRMAWAAAFIVNLIFIFLCQSRTTIAALIPALVVISCARSQKKFLIPFLGISLLTVTFFLRDAILMALTRDISGYRIDIWKATIAKNLPHLFWGQGYFSDTALRIGEHDIMHAHNIYIAAFRDGGMVGLLLLLAIVGMAVWCAWRQSRVSNRFLNLALVTFGSLAVFFDNDRLVDNPEELWIFFWYPLCRIVAHDLDRNRFVGSSSHQRVDNA